MFAQSFRVTDVTRPMRIRPARAALHMCKAAVNKPAVHSSRNITTVRRIMVPYVSTTEGITVTVRPVYLDQESDILNNRFVFAYYVKIENNSDYEVQLLRRRWLIKESDGRVQEVEGDGVVGKKPVLPPGNYHDYNSYCVLTTFEGTMEGSYLMERADGDRFRVTIPLFNLRAAAN